ncbi:uncharacterized protein LOC125945853 [Dermacentor silvarum]|uniref:uncharacterized protein LOC125945853 n=1 Tax=Dermacentor silvarum TaxID=543639 RepID=UPI002100F783|nr:uncharacterized protein LOC125945853 [Dermacentor silvarum]
MEVSITATSRELDTAVASTRETMRAIMLFLVFGLFADVYGAGLEDLVNALNTTQAIWLYNRSYDVTVKGGNQKCVRWHLESLTRSSYDFENYYKVNEAYFGENGTHATLDAQGDKATLSVTYQSEGEVSYTLQKWDPSGKCFVLTRNTGNEGETKCELHLWQEKVTQGHSTSCDEEYKKLCDGEQKEVFTEHDCM